MHKYEVNGLKVYIKKSKKIDWELVFGYAFLGFGIIGVLIQYFYVVN